MTIKEVEEKLSNMHFDSIVKSYCNKVNDIKRLKAEIKKLNEQLRQPDFCGNAYLIKLGHFIDSGYLEQVGTNEEAIEKIVTEAAKRNDLPGVKEIIEVELVDLFHLVVHYKYKDWSDEIENGQLFLSKFSVVS